MVPFNDMANSSAPKKRLYSQMLRIRRVEERIADLYPEQQMRCPIHLSIGQEAAAVGVCAALCADDWALSGHRSHGHYLAKGGALKAMLAVVLLVSAGGCAVIVAIGAEAGRGGVLTLAAVD